MTNTGPPSYISVKNYKCRKDSLHNTSVHFISWKAAVETVSLENSWSCRQNSVVTVEADVSGSWEVL